MLSVLPTPQDLECAVVHRPGGGATLEDALYWEDKLKDVDARIIAPCPSTSLLP